MDGSSSVRRNEGDSVHLLGMGTSLTCLPTVGIGAAPGRDHVPRCLHLPVTAKPAPVTGLVPPKSHCLAVSASEDRGTGQVAEVAADSLTGALCAALPKQLAAKMPTK